MCCAAIYVLGVVLTPILVGMFVDKPMDPVDQGIPLAFISWLTIRKFLENRKEKKGENDAQKKEENT